MFKTSFSDNNLQRSQEGKATSLCKKNGETKASVEASDDKSDSGKPSVVCRGSTRPRSRPSYAETQLDARLPKTTECRRPSPKRQSLSKNQRGAIQGGREYRVKGLIDVSREPGGPMRFKVDWKPTWQNFHDLRGKDLFEEAAILSKEKLGNDLWEEVEGPTSMIAALTLNEDDETE